MELHTIGIDLGKTVYGFQKDFRLTQHFLRRKIAGGIFYHLKCPPAAGSAPWDSWRLETILMV